MIDETLLRQAAKSGVAVPVLASTGANRRAGIELPLDCRIVISGTIGQYQAWCASDIDVAPLVRLINAFEPATARVPDPVVAAAA